MKKSIFPITMSLLVLFFLGTIWSSSSFKSEEARRIEHLLSLASRPEIVSFALPTRTWEVPETGIDRISPPAELPQEVGPNTLVNDPDGDPYPNGIMQSEESIAADGDHIIVNWNDSYGFYDHDEGVIGYGWSVDGGETWVDGGGLPHEAPSGYIRGDPVAVTDGQGNFWFASIYQPPNGQDGLGVNYAYFDGDTLMVDEPITAISSTSYFYDKEYMTADPSNSYLYMSYTRFGYNGQIEVIRSTDLGQTWSDPTVVVTEDPSRVNQGSYPYVGPDNEVYVAWEHDWLGSNPQIKVAKSTDFGDSFSTGVTVTPIVSIAYEPPPGFNRPVINDFPSIAVDRSGGPHNGTVYVTFHDKVLGDADVYCSKSTDGGTTWSTPVRLNDDEVGNGALQFWPWVSVDDRGHVHVTWYDRRLDPSNILTDLYYTTSKDGGETFEPNTRVTDESSSWFVECDATPNFGDYINNTADGHFVHAVWADGRLGTPDVYYAKIQTAADEIAGTVINSLDFNPIAGVQVEVIETEETGTTDSTGYYSIWSDYPDTVTVAASKFGFAPDTSLVVVTHDSTTIHDIELDPLNPGGLGGSVTDLETGDGILAMVTVLYLGTPVLQTETDPITGAYLFIVPEGTYDVRVVPDLPYLPDSRQDVAVVEGELTTLDFPLLSITTFTDISSGAGVDDAGFGQGAAWGDMDGDGLPDLYVCNLTGSNVLYRNLGGGLFQDVTVASGTGDASSSFGCIWGDYDEDGDQDLYVTNRNDANRLYQNDGSGTFTDMAAFAGVDADTVYSQACTWVDYDEDGDLDLFVANRFATDFLFSNDGDGTFTEVGASSGLTGTVSSRGAAWCDYDSDGDMDVFVTVNGTENMLYQNQWDGTFIDVASSLGLDDAGAGTGVAWGDIDEDGDFDLFVANDGSANLLYLNNGGSFTEAASDAGLDYTGTSRSPVWADTDKDGDLDLLLTTGLGVRYYVNDGTGQFTEVSSASGLFDSSLGEGAATADIDEDGDLDYYIARSQLAPNRLYENDGNIYHYLGVKLTGRLSNVDAIGARITVNVNGRSLVREVSGGSGFFSMNDKTQYFGLGQETMVDEVVINWPSGRTQTLTGLSADQVLEVSEPGAVVHRVAHPL
ncbi:MAG: FG-GAP-like repeat-containing protein [Candidatus Glassbacteria bacterium]